MQVWKAVKASALFSCFKKMMFWILNVKYINKSENILWLAACELICFASCSFYAKVSSLHAELYKSSGTAMTNPLVTFTLIKRLHSEWLNVVNSEEALENIQGLFLASLQAHLLLVTTHPLFSAVHLLTLCYPALRSSYVEEEADLPKLEDLQGAAKGLMRLQDVYSLQVASLVNGHFRRVTNGESVDIYLPAVSVQLSGDDCFLVGKVHKHIFFLYCF